jgi:hypothetical protein
MTATQLKAVNSLLDTVPTEVGIDLQVTEPQARELLNKWMSGNTKLPEWYITTRGTLSFLAKRMRLLPPDLLNVELVTPHHSPLVRTALKLAATGHFGYTCQNDTVRLAEFDQKVREILAELDV